MTQAATETEDLDAQRPGSGTSGTVFLHSKTNEQATANHKKTKSGGREELMGTKDQNPRTQKQNCDLQLEAS
jgi:hypothetical protein